MRLVQPGPERGELMEGDEMDEHTCETDCYCSDVRLGWAPSAKHLADYVERLRAMAEAAQPAALPACE